VEGVTDVNNFFMGKMTNCHTKKLHVSNIFRNFRVWKGGQYEVKSTGEGAPI